MISLFRLSRIGTRSAVCGHQQAPYTASTIHLHFDAKTPNKLVI